MTNLKDAETRVTVGDSKNLTGTKHGNRYGHQRLDGKLHHMTLSNRAVITGLHANIFSTT